MEPYDAMFDRNHDGELDFHERVDMYDYYDRVNGVGIYENDEEIHALYGNYGGSRYGGGSRSDGHSPWFWAFVVGMIFAYIAPDISGEAFIVTLIIAALAKKFG